MGLNFLVLGQDGIAAVGDQISLRLSAGGESHSRLDILLRNIRVVTDKTAYRVILLAVLALLLALFIRRKPRRFDSRALLLLLPLLAPVLWTLALQPRIRPHLLTYRNLCGAFSRLRAPPLLAPDRTLPLNPRERHDHQRAALHQDHRGRKKHDSAPSKLFVTQPSLSHCVMTLEQQLGTELFTRTAGGLVLTYAGEKYYRVTARCCASTRRLSRRSTERARAVARRVTVSITNYLATALICRACPAFHREHSASVRICGGQPTRWAQPA